MHILCHTYCCAENWFYESQAASGPKDVVIVIDTSGSMTTAGRMSKAKEAAHTIIEALTDDDYVNIVRFR
jgi:Mg-chelatase subunit ChlD